MNEPLIVVEESGGIAEEEEEDESKPSSADESPSNQFLLTPWRDMRKRSLPTPPCTSGITASQVRRLSERGGEGSGPSPIEQAFLATLSQAPTPAPGARRHSVVTISRAPPTTTIFGRNRRESIAAFTAGFTGLQRKDSTSNQPRGSIGGGGSNSGSSFNLQLDIMDDITEAKAKAKERRKLNRSQSKELPDESTPNQDNTLSAGTSKAFDRRYSDFTCTSKTAQSLTQKRRASELLPLNFNSLSNKKSPGIVCSNNDLISILSPLTSSAQEICSDAEKEKEPPILTANPNTGSPTQPKSVVDKKKKQLKDRSNSFDVGYLPGTSSNPASWFTKRHQPIAKKEAGDSKSNIIVTFTDEKQKPKTSLVFTPDRTKPSKNTTEVKKVSPTSEKTRVVWDNKSGSVVDPQLLGSAIEVFLTQKSSQETSSSVAKVSPKDSPTKSSSTSSKTWLGSNTQEQGEESSESCESSICSTLKDLFVK